MLPPHRPPTHRLKPPPTDACLRPIHAADAVRPAAPPGRKPLWKLAGAGRGCGARPPTSPASMRRPREASTTRGVLSGIRPSSRSSRDCTGGRSPGVRTWMHIIREFADTRDGCIRLVGEPLLRRVLGPAGPRVEQQCGHGVGRQRNEHDDEQQGHGGRGPAGGAPGRFVCLCGVTERGEHRHAGDDQGDEVGHEQRRPSRQLSPAQPCHREGRDEGDGDRDSGQHGGNVPTGQRDRADQAGRQGGDQVHEARRRPRRDLAVGQRVVVAGQCHRPSRPRSPAGTRGGRPRPIRCGGAAPARGRCP